VAPLHWNEGNLVELFVRLIRSAIRSSVLSLIAAVLCLLTAGTANAAENAHLFYVGTYTDYGSKGIYAYRFDSATGKVESLGLAAESVEPSFLAVSPNGKFIYAVNETDAYNGQPTGAVSAFAIQSESGKLSLLNQVSSRDEGPAYIAQDHTGKYAMVANYTLGSVAVLPVMADGRLGEAAAFVRHKGSSVNPDRQKGPHAHAVAFSPDNRFAIVADLGLDELLVYPFDAANGKLGAVAQTVKTNPGAGPRHLVFGVNGRFLYLVNEIQSTVVSFAYDAQTGKLRELQTLSTLPQTFSGENTAAEIDTDPSGKFVFASNRGDDSIAVFAIDPKNGTLKLVEIDSTRGKTPRNFALDPSGEWLFAANEDSDDIVIFHVNVNTGHLTSTRQQIQVPSPVCVKFIPGGEQ
jgi:6-phosphogluconolactonase